MNEVICHGIPDARPLVDGDIVNLDVTLFHNGFHGDLNATCLSALARRPTDPADPVGEKVSPLNLALIATARACLDEAIRVSKPGYLFRDLGELIEATARKGGFSVNKTYCGHGINQLFHCAPSIPVRPICSSVGRADLWTALQGQQSDGRDESGDGEFVPCSNLGLTSVRRSR